MMLQHVFQADRIKIGLESEDKDEVFEELVNVLSVSCSKGFDRKLVLQAIRERESKMSTGIKRGLAIPHGKTDSVDSVYGVIGISKNGIEYDALDGEPVFILFMLISSYKDSEQHLRILKKLAQLLDNSDFIQELQGSSNNHDAWKVIRKYEDMIIRD